MKIETHGTIAIAAFVLGVVLVALGARGPWWAGLTGACLLTTSLVSIFFVFLGINRELARGGVIEHRPRDDVDQPGPGAPTGGLGRELGERRGTEAVHADEPSHVPGSGSKL